MEYLGGSDMSLWETSSFKHCWNGALYMYHCTDGDNDKKVSLVHHRGLG